MTKGEKKKHENKGRAGVVEWWWNVVDSSKAPKHPNFSFKYKSTTSSIYLKRAC
jgi:hypothetical protein